MLRVLNLGAGVQSTAVLLMMMHGEIEPAKVAIFSDTQWEPPEVYAHLEWLEQVTADSGIEIRRISRGNLRTHATTGKPAISRPGNHYCTLPVFVSTSKGTAAIAPRQCTTDYKIRPIQQEIKRLLGLRKKQRWPKAPAVVQVFGISWDERERMRSPKEPWALFDYPLCDRKLTRRDSLDWLERHYPGRAVPRSACIGCPYHNNAEWRRIRASPELWADAVEADAIIRKAGRDKTPSEAFLHRSMLPLDMAPIDDEPADEWATGIGNECQGMCGV